MLALKRRLSFLRFFSLFLVVSLTTFSTSMPTLFGTSGTGPAVLASTDWLGVPAACTWHWCCAVFIPLLTPAALLPHACSVQTNDPAGFTVVDVMAWGALGHAGALRAVAMRCDACHVGQVAVLLQRSSRCAVAMECRLCCCNGIPALAH